MGREWASPRASATGVRRLSRKKLRSLTRVAQATPARRVMFYSSSFCVSVANTSNRLIRFVLSYSLSIMLFRSSIIRGKGEPGRPVGWIDQMKCMPITEALIEILKPESP